VGVANLSGFSQGQSTATKVWLYLLEAEPRRKKQSALVRDMLRVICATEGIDLGSSELNIPGLELVELFSSRYNTGLSIAHCRGMLAVALGPGRVGVDCELQGRRRNWQAIAQQFFTPAEAHTISAVRPENREPVFLRHWVLKEAYVKAIRGSIFGDLNRLTVTALGSELAILECNIQDNWRAWEIEVSGGMIAVCSSQSEAVVFSLVGSLSNDSTTPVVTRLVDAHRQLTCIRST